jgi:hypothetical protein
MLLKAKYDEAKALGEAVNASKARINELKGQIELWRAQQAAACKYSPVRDGWVGGWPILSLKQSIGVLSGLPAASNCDSAFQMLSLCGRNSTGLQLLTND